MRAPDPGMAEKKIWCSYIQRMRFLLGLRGDLCSPPMLRVHGLNLSSGGSNP